LAENTISHSVTADDLSFEQPAGLDWPPFVHTFPSVAASGVLTVTYHCTVHPSMTGTVVISSLPPAITGLTAGNDGPAKVSNPVHFTASVTTGGEPISYTWDFGDGSAGTGVTPTHTYTQSGIYTATVTATNATNSLKTTTTVYVGDAVVETTPDLKFDPAVVNIPVGGLVVWVSRPASGPHGVISDVGVTPGFVGPTGNNWIYAHTFDSAGEFKYHCIIHGLSMSGKVVVGNAQNILLPQIGKNP